MRRDPIDWSVVSFDETARMRGLTLSWGTCMRPRARSDSRFVW